MATSRRCTSTRPGCPTPASTRSTAASTRWGRRGCGRRSRWSTPRSPSTSCWPASARPATCWCRTPEENKLDRHLFNEAFLMHTSTSPQYAIIASCDVAAAMMEPPGGTALVEESILEALDFRPRHAQGGPGVRQGLVVQGLGARQAGGRGHRPRRRLDHQGRVPLGQVARLRQPRPRASTCWTRSSPPSSRPAWT
jgi:hypothetical protein